MRWLLASLLIAIVFIEHSWLWSLAHLGLFFLLMWVLAEKLQLVYIDWLRSWRVLRWLIVPIIIFHILFTPGEIIWVGFALPISYEGLILAWHLSLKLCEMFICAVLLGRLLPMQLWLQSLGKIAGVQDYIEPYVRLLPLMLRRVSVVVRQTYRSWRLEPDKLKTLAPYMMDLIVRVEGDSRRRAKYVWLSWDKPTKAVGGLLNDQLVDCHLAYMALLLGIYVVCEFGVRYTWN